MSPAEMAKTVADLIADPTDAGNLIDAARMAADLLLELAPQTAHDELDAAAVRRGGMAYEAARAAKFGPRG
jgi:hypothetical protein